MAIAGPIFFIAHAVFYFLIVRAYRAFASGDRDPGSRDGERVRGQSADGLKNRGQDDEGLIRTEEERRDGGWM
jgi:hypothetical protein